jgi:hypothetical protein
MNTSAAAATLRALTFDEMLICVNVRLRAVATRAAARKGSDLPLNAPPSPLEVGASFPDGAEPLSDTEHNLRRDVRCVRALPRTLLRSLFRHRSPQRASGGIAALGRRALNPVPNSPGTHRASERLRGRAGRPAPVLTQNPGPCPRRIEPSDRGSLDILTRRPGCRKPLTLWHAAGIATRPDASPGAFHAPHHPKGVGAPTFPDDQLFRRAMCRWCVVMFILAVVGAAIIYWRILWAATARGHAPRSRIYFFHLWRSHTAQSWTAPLRSRRPTRVLCGVARI